MATIMALPGDGSDKSRSSKWAIKSAAMLLMRGAVPTIFSSAAQRDFKRDCSILLRLRQAHRLAHPTPAARFR